MKTALVLEGGAKRGIYTAGILDVFMENNIKVDAVIGVSAGAIHGCSYAAQQIGRSIRYNINYNDDYRFMSLRSWIKTGNVVDTDFSYHTLPEKLDPVDNKTFKTSGIKFYAVCTNIKTGKAEYILCKDMFKDVDYIRASASLPFLSHIVKIKGKEYLDGSICDSIPLKASQNLGYSKNIVILTRPFGYRKKSSLLLKILTPLVYKKYPKFVKRLLNRYKMYNSQLDFINSESKNSNTLTIQPSKKIHIAKMEHRIEKIKEMYNLGRSDATKFLPKIKDFLK